MKQYYYEREYTIWQRVIIEANSEEEARELGDEALDNGEGILLEEGLEPTGGTWIQEGDD